MSLSKDVPSSFLNAPDLLHDPRTNYFLWKAALLRFLLPSSPRISSPAVCSSYRLSRSMMRFPSIWCRDQSSQDLLWPPPIAPVAGNTTLRRETFASELSAYEALVLVQARLKTAIIASILPADLVALRDPVHGDLLLYIPWHSHDSGTCCLNSWECYGRGPFGLEGRAAWETVLIDRLSQARGPLRRKVPEVAPRRTYRALGAVWDLREHLLAPPCFSKSKSVLRSEARPEKAHGVHASGSPLPYPTSKTYLLLPCSFWCLGFPRSPECCSCGCSPCLSFQNGLQKGG